MKNVCRVNLHKIFIEKLSLYNIVQQTFFFNYKSFFPFQTETIGMCISSKITDFIFTLFHIETGSCILICEDTQNSLKLEMVGWRGVMSLRAYVPIHDAIHYLRLLGGDCDKFGERQLFPFFPAYQVFNFFLRILFQKKTNLKRIAWQLLKRVWTMTKLSRKMETQRL